jgi:hypothetical protein
MFFLFKIETWHLNKINISTITSVYNYSGTELLISIVNWFNIHVGISKNKFGGMPFKYQR